MRMCFWHGNADCDRKGKEDGNLNGNSTNLGQKNKCYFSKISCIFQKKMFSKNRFCFWKKKYGGFQGIATLIVKVLSMLSQELTLHVLFRESRLSSRPFVKSRWSWESKTGIGKRYFFLVHMTWCVSFSIFFDVWKRKCGDKIWVMVKFDFDVCFFTLEYLQAIKECNGVWHWSSILKWHNSTYKKILALGLWDSFCSWLWWQRKTQCGSMAMHN